MMENRDNKLPQAEGAALMHSAAVSRPCCWRGVKKGVAGFEKRLSRLWWCATLYGLPYQAVVRREVQLAALSTTDRALQIGCGAMPFTAIYIHRQSGAAVLAVDRDLQAVLQARLLLRRMGLQRWISCLHADASQDHLPQATAAFVALQAAPKDAVIERLRSSLCPQCGRMIVRLPRPAFREEYGSCSYEQMILPQVHHRMPTFDRSIMLSTGGRG